MVEVETKKILFLTGTRADFGKLKSLIQAIDDLDDFEYRIFVTGMHLLKQYGNTYKEVHRSGFSHIHKFINQHMNEPMEMVLANTIQGLSRYIHENHPDMIVVHGDRVEAMAGAIVGSMNNILVAHIEGGERSGTIDELIRHSVTKLSHIHLVANNEARKRIIQLGESPSSVFIIGSPDIDVMKSDKLPNIDEVKDYYDIPFDTYHLVLFHPVTTEINDFQYYSNQLVDALIATDENYIIIYPNNDHGTNEIMSAYKRLLSIDRIKMYPSIRFESFLTLIEYAKSVIGNSSAGIREAPIYGIPSINIGTRQTSRFKSASIIDCTYKKTSIMKAIKSLDENNGTYATNEYFGEGNSALEFKKLISEKNKGIWNISPQKIFIDI